ncbi:MAG TPA: hypothetical protein VE219_05365 [Candidatus Sulfotelmatobacter sp.]|nr:hypothetical protein [Candidatus Sulfotelmatobacter sp.]
MKVLLAASDGEVYTLWWISVAVMFVVCIVAAGLLQNILVVGRNIGTNVHEIWTVGKRIANHTVQLWLLGRVNGLVGQIHTSAGRINNTAAAIAEHARTCQHCPACVSPLSSARRGESEPAGTGGRP